MSRKTVEFRPGSPRMADNDGIGLRGARLLGGDGEPPMPVNVILLDEKERKRVYPVVGLHFLTTAMQADLQLILETAIEQVLTKHGLINQDACPTIGGDDE